MCDMLSALSRLALTVVNIALCGTGITYTQYRGIMENMRHGAIFPWRCQSCKRTTETETQQPAATDDGNVEACVDGDSEIADTVIGAPEFESTRLDTTFTYVLFSLYSNSKSVHSGTRTSRQPGHFQVTKVVRQVKRSKGARSDKHKTMS